MIIDLILAVLLAIALVKGYRRGLIVALFSVVALIVGLAAAIKLSAVVAGYIGNTVKVSEKWLPIVAFLVVLVIVVVVINMVGKVLQTAVESVMLGWINRLGGMLFYGLFYLLLYSILLFYATQIGFIKPETIQDSASYAHIAPLGPAAVEKLGIALPWFRDMFEELKTFFDGVSRQIPVSQ